MTPWTRLRAAVHQLDTDEACWVQSLCDEARGLLDDGRGVFSYSYRVRDGSRIELGHLAGRQSAPDVWRALEYWGARNQAALARMYATGASYASHALASAARAGLSVPDFSDSLEPQGVMDLFTVVAHDRAGFGVFLTAPRATRCETLPAKSRRAFERLAAELVAAMRLREHRGRAQAARLSAAEALVARRFLEGASDKAIALELNVAVSTVSTFARRVREKLGCRPGEELLLLSERRDLLSQGRDFASMQRRLALFERLSRSECEVASELLIGSSYSEIAERRDVSVRTVASQCAAIFRKCGVSGRRELAATLFGR